MNIIERKKALRNAVTQRVEELSKEYVEYSNKKIFDAIIALPEYEKAKTFFCFVGRDIEIDTLPIIEHAMKNGKIVGIPKCVGKRLMAVREFKSLDNLELSNFGILEPKDDARLINSEEIDFSLVPCMSCNEKGHRLGYGGGFYDTFLETNKSFTCLICRHKIMTDEIPLEAHDRTPDMLVTDELINRFNK